MHLWTVENPCTQEIKLLTSLLINNHGKNKIRGKINDHLIEKLTKQPFNLHIPSCYSFHISFCSVSSASTARQAEEERKKNELLWTADTDWPICPPFIFLVQQKHLFPYCAAQAPTARSCSLRYSPCGITYCFPILITSQSIFVSGRQMRKKFTLNQFRKTLLCSCFLCEQGRKIRHCLGAGLSAALPSSQGSDRDRQKSKKLHRRCQFNHPTSFKNIFAILKK